MTDPVLTDDEKDALLDGMSTGEVEVHTKKGQAYAEVTPFEVGPRSRIVTNSYPRLQSLNRQFASRMGKQIELLLNAESDVTFSDIRNCTYSEFSEQSDGLSLLLEFAPKPLQGSALISLAGSALETLVETFFGGDSSQSSRKDAEFFTPGEISVANLFGRALLAVTSDVWQPMAEFEPEQISTHLSSGVIDCIDASDNVIVAAFNFTIGEKTECFDILWPVATVAPLLPVFEGQKRERDAAQDAHWEQSLRARVVESVVNISSGVGATQMALGEIADLEPGDVINISNPQKGTVFAQKVAVLAGRFGVHDGRYAIETTHWLEPNSGGDAATNQH